MDPRDAMEPEQLEMLTRIFAEQLVGLPRGVRARAPRSLL